MIPSSVFDDVRSTANNKLAVVNRWVGKSKKWTEMFFESLDKHLSIKCVVLLGSAIRQRGHRRSDFDLLVVYDEKKRPKLGAPIEVDVRQYAQAGLEKKIATADEVLCWALKYGVVAYDPDGIWNEFLQYHKDRIPLPSRTKAEHRAYNSLQKACDMLENGDEFGAEDLILASLTQFVRSELISKGVFPASRPELPRQLREVLAGSPLANLLDEAMYGNKDSSILIDETVLVIKTIEQP